MAGTTNYPASVDTFMDPNPTDPTTSPSHAQLHQDLNARVAAVQNNVTQAVNGGREKLVAASVGAASYTINLASGNWFVITLTGNGALVFPSGLTTAGIQFFLRLKQDATGSRTRTWPASISWVGGSAPTLTTTANKSDDFTFYTVDGGNTWVGSVIGQAL